MEDAKDDRPANLVYVEEAGEEERLSVYGSVIAVERVKVEITPEHAAALRTHMKDVAQRGVFSETILGAPMSIEDGAAFENVWGRLETVVHDSMVSFRAYAKHAEDTVEFIVTFDDIEDHLLEIGALPPEERTPRRDDEVQAAPIPTP